MTAVPITEEQRAALDVLRSAERVLLTGHERPDGDCIGAQAALSRVLEAMGKKVWILNPGPPEPQYSYLSDECRYGSYTGQNLPVHDVVCLLDGGELSRTGALAEPLAKAPSKKVVIDHHIPPSEPWWDAVFADVTASATGLLVWRIAKALGVELDRVACEGVFTSMVTDTGWFKYSNTDAETLAVASEVVAAGVSPNRLYDLIFQRRRMVYPFQVSKALETVDYHADGRLAVVSIPFDEAMSSGFETDDVLDLLRAVSSVEVVMLLRENSNGTCKLSARSKTEYDVNHLARRFGGGGHAKASGATLNGALGEMKAQLVEAALEGFETV